MEIERKDGSQVEVTQEMLAAQFNKGYEDKVSDKAATVEKIGDLGIDFGKNEGDNEGGAGGDEGNGELVNLSTDEIDAYKDFLGGDIPDTVYKDESGKAFSKKEVIYNLNKIVADKSVSNYQADPFIASYVKAKATDGFNHDDYVKSLNANQKYYDMKDDDLLRLIQKNQGKDDKVIDDWLNSTNVITKEQMAKNARAQIKENEQAQRNETFKQNADSRKQKISVLNERSKSTIDKYAQEAFINEFPIRLDDSTKDRVINTMKSLMQHEIVERDGNYEERLGLDEFLRNDDLLLKALPYIAMIKEGIDKDQINGYINKVKNKEFEKIEGGDNGLGSGGNSKGIDFKALYK